MVKGEAIWHCKIGNKKKWKPGQTLSRDLDLGPVRCTLADRQKDYVKFEWNKEVIFSELIESLGKVPLPPYIHRDPEFSDKERYQTTYAETNGAVAAPTAGLHFSEEVLEALNQRQIPLRHLTLHVSAGTFQPISTDKVEEHPMHYEQVEINRGTLEKLVDDKMVTAVGTTSLRTLESIFWFGYMLEKDPEIAAFNVSKETIFVHNDTKMDRNSAIQNVLKWMDHNNLTVLKGNTGIFVIPGYTFRVANALITNFHMPGSTLILLVAAFIGEDWKTVYTEALKGNYRFLSYGDSSLLIR